MVTISKIYFCLLLVFITKCANGLRCYYCTSSNSIYNEACRYGTNALPSGDCPIGFTSCFVRYAEDADGNFNIVRDCSHKDGPASWNYTIEVTIGCEFDLCNVGYLGTTESVLETTEPSLFSNTDEMITDESTQPSTQPNSSATGIPDTISIWILAFATTLCYV